MAKISIKIVKKFKFSLFFKFWKFLRRQGDRPRTPRVDPLYKPSIASPLPPKNSQGR